jgi:hypothetical protein
MIVRLLYIIPLILFITGFIHRINDLEYNSSLGIKYKYVFIPILIFAYQTIRNSKVGWILVMILYLVFLFFWIYELIGEYYLIGAKYTYDQYFFWWVYVMIYLGIGWIYYKLRPKDVII